MSHTIPLIFSALLLFDSSVLANEPLKVGFLYPSQSETNQNRAKELRCISEGVLKEAIKNGVKITYRFLPYEQDLLVAASSASEAVKSDIDLAAGTLFSKEAIIVGDIFEKSKKLLIVPSATNPQVTAGKSNIFRLAFSDTQQAKVLSNLTIKEEKSKEILVIKNESDPYSSFLADRFSENLKMDGAPNVTTLSIITGERDFNLTKKALAKKNYDLIFAPLYHPELAALYQVLKESGKKLTLLGSDSVGGHDVFIRMLGGTSDKIKFIFTKQWSGVLENNATSEELKLIILRYCGKMDVNMQMVTAFDAAKFLVEIAKRKLKTKSTDLQSVVEQTKANGVLGPIEFSQGKRDANRNIFLFELKEDGSILKKVFKNE